MIDKEKIKANFKETVDTIVFVIVAVILIRFFIFNRRPIFALTVFLILGGLRRLFL